MATVKEKARPAQTAGRPRAITDLELVESFRKGLTVSRKLTVGKVAEELQRSEFGYPRAAAEKVAKDLSTAFSGTKEEVQRMINRDGISRTDNLVKKALLLRNDTDDILALRLLTNLPKEDLTEELLEEILPSMPTRARNEVISIVLPEEKRAIESREDIQRAFDQLKEGKAGTRFSNLRLAFTPEASEQLEYGMKFMDTNRNGEYHRLARVLPRLKLNPFGNLQDGSPARGRSDYGERSKIIYEGREYTVYHAGAKKMDLRAYYIVKDETIIILEIIPGKNH